MVDGGSTGTGTAISRGGGGGVLLYEYEDALEPVTVHIPHSNDSRLVWRGSFWFGMDVDALEAE